MFLQRCFSNSVLRFGALFGTVLSSRATPFVFSASTLPAALVSAHQFPQIPQIRGARACATETASTLRWSSQERGTKLLQYVFDDKPKLSVFYFSAGRA